MCVCACARVCKKESEREKNTTEKYLSVILKHLMITSRTFYYRWINISSTTQRLNPGFRGLKKNLTKKGKKRQLEYPEFPEFSCEGSLRK